MNKIFLLRHGENQANLTKEFSYKLVDYPLNQKGVLQAQQTGKYLKQKKIDAIFTSPLKRAAQTAEIVANILDLPFTICEAFREVNVGDLEKQPPSQETWSLFREIVHAWVRGEYQTAFPNGEDYRSLWSRYQRGLLNAIQNYPKGNILVVGHGGIFTFTLPDLCAGINIAELFKSENPNASITEIALKCHQDHLKGSLIMWAYTGHLHGKAAELVSGTPKKEAYN